MSKANRRDSYKVLELKSREGSSSKKKKMLLWLLLILFCLFLGRGDKKQVYSEGEVARDYSAFFLVVIICVLTFSGLCYKHLESRTDSHLAS